MHMSSLSFLNSAQARTYFRKCQSPQYSIQRYEVSHGSTQWPDLNSCCDDGKPQYYAEFLTLLDDLDPSLLASSLYLHKIDFNVIPRSLLVQYTPPIQLRVSATPSIAAANLSSSFMLATHSQSLIGVIIFSDKHCVQSYRTQDIHVVRHLLHRSLH